MQPVNDDYDLGDLFRERRAASQKKRADNREFSTAKLTEKGIPFTSHNAGAHFIVASAWNFWPGTGRFEERKGRPGIPPRKGRGVFSLIKLIEEAQCKSS